jgi:hypothetical protein
MEGSYQIPGAYVPYFTPCGGYVNAGSPSPPLSLCSEPIHQFPMPDGRCASPGFQQKTSRMQLLNKTVVDARKKKIVARGHNLPSRAEPPDMMNFFRSAATFPEQLSDSGDGSIRARSESPSLRSNSPFAFSPSYSSRFQCLPFDSPLQHQQYEQMGQVTHLINWQNWQTPNWYASAFPTWEQPACPNQIPHSTCWEVKQQTQDTRTMCCKTKDEVVERNTKSVRKPTKTKREAGSNAKKKCHNATENTDVLKIDRTTHNSRLRKQRKRVQQKNKSLHKTELCTHWTLTSTCTFKGKCYFAHGIDELQNRIRVYNYKTRPCVDCPTEKGQCFFGSRCNYCHPGEAIRRAVSSSYIDKDYYTDLRKEFRNNEYPFGIFI